MITRRKTVMGVAVSAGIVMGRAQVVLPGYTKVAEVPITTSRIKSEQRALDRAVEETVQEIEELRDSAAQRLGAQVASVFEAQLLIASDKSFLDEVKNRIGIFRRNAGFVYNSLVQETTHKLKHSVDPYMQAMGEEIEGVSNRVLSHLSGYRERSTVRFKGDRIMVGKSFTPGEVLSYRNRKAVGFLAGEGGANSHMALIARSLMTPMLIVDDIWSQVQNNCRIIVDGTDGRAIINPSDEEWSEYQRKKKRQGPALLTRIKKLTKIPPTTSDGRVINVSANLELPGPVDDILAAQKFPVGLYRTEFLYLNSDGFPDEDQQFEYYDRIASKYEDSYVVLRTFDLGSDKVRFDGDIGPRETNPALGWRGIRLMLEMTDIFKTQLRAILRASTRGNVRILLPMITELEELQKARRIVSQVKFSLRRAGIRFDEDIPVGIMVEVPSAALTAHRLALDADFVSIGTNDLTQYTMSADRGNSRVMSLYNSFHPSVLSLIQMTIVACQQAGTPLSICGEMAGDPLALPLFIGMGVSDLSMNPAKIFDSCRLISKIDFNLVKHLVGPVLSSHSSAGVMRKLQNYRNALEKK
ncbi:MAG: phosphoenolpyruvate--protein phosphotransferase [candidate division Zixibacteria bacterium]|nr:phosphoenolpyruvate--protein phosphotransferase [candidate division Zixibacteria bacterium]